MEKIVNTVFAILSLVVLVVIGLAIFFTSNNPNVHIDSELFNNKPKTQRDGQLFENLDKNKKYIVNDVKSNEVIVKILSGSLKGKRLTVFGSTIYAFVGIPYAKPPVGKLRFSKPEPIKSWTGIRPALNFTPMCPQYIIPKDIRPINYISENMSEDCLSLNIWTPDIKPTKLKTVMIWIHGGGFLANSANLHETDGRLLSSYGDVVVVTINYRMNSFGFLNTRTKGAPGNMGIYDQSLALLWIKDNIKTFGGDPKKLVPFGQSAGSISIGLLMTYNKTKDLFSRAITQSGSFLVSETTKTFHNSVKLAKLVGCLEDYQESDEDFDSFTDDEVDCLKSAPFDKILEATNNLLNQTLTPFIPSIDDYNEDFQSPMNYIHEEDSLSNMKELLSGITADEGTWLMLIIDPNLFKPNSYPQLKTLKETRQMFVDLSLNKSDFPENFIRMGAQSFIDGPEEDTSINNIKRLTNIFADTLIVCPTIFFANEMIARNKSVYMYYFNHRPKSSKFGEWLGIIHYEEVPFVFGYPLRRPKLYDKQDIELSKRIIKVWTHFAKTGQVLSQLDLIWPKYNDNKSYMVLQPNHSSIVNNIHEKNCELYTTMSQISG